MKRFRLVPCLLLAFFTLCVSSARATELPVTADAHVNSTRTTTNFGYLSNLYVGNGNTALVQFDLTALPPGIVASQVSRATVTLFVNRVNAAGTVNVAPVTSTWGESSVTYASIPTMGATSATFTAATPGQYVTFDVTGLVQGWISNPASNFGIALSSSAANILLDSKENDQTGHAAGISVTI
ncbi:MAG TPA: DNRLRE domain-containing protein, partial [Acidobacteriaceae bacterium]